MQLGKKCPANAHHNDLTHSSKVKRCSHLYVDEAGIRSPTSLGAPYTDSATLLPVGEIVMTPEEFRRFGHQLIDWIADYRIGIAERPVMAQTVPGEIKDQLPVSPPEQPEDFADVFRDLERVIVPGLSHWQHPHFFGYFPANADLASVLGDYLSTGLGVLGLSWQASPALTELEEVVTDWMRQLVGLSPAWSGVIQDTASTSTLVALLCARERTTDYGLSRGGLQAETRPLIVYTSAQSHSSVEKAALLAGFGRDERAPYRAR